MGSYVFNQCTKLRTVRINATSLTFADTWGSGGYGSGPTTGRGIFSEIASGSIIHVRNQSVADTLLKANSYDADNTKVIIVSSELPTSNTPITQLVAASNKSVAMGKTVAIGAKTNGNGKLTYKSSNTNVAKVDASGKITPVKVGKTTITITAAKTSEYAAANKTITATVTKGANPVTAKGKTVTVKASKVRKANQAVAAKKAYSVTKAQGKITYKKASGNKKITVASNGKITVKKGLKKGSYKVKVRVTAKGNANWKSKSKNITVTIKVK